MTAAGYVGGEVYCRQKGDSQRRVQSGYDPKPSEQRKVKGARGTNGGG